MDNVLTRYVLCRTCPNYYRIIYLYATLASIHLSRLFFTRNKITDIAKAITTSLVFATLLRKQGSQASSIPSCGEQYGEFWICLDDRAQKLQVCDSISSAVVHHYQTCLSRNSSDDGILSGLLLGPLVSSSLLYIALNAFSNSPDADVLNASWYIERPQSLPNSGHPYTPLEALVLSRRSAVDLATLCSVILLTHVCTSKWYEARCRRQKSAAEGERASVPRSEARKVRLYVAMALVLCCILLVLRVVFQITQIGIWQSMCVAVPLMRSCMLMVTRFRRHDLLGHCFELCILSNDAVHRHQART